MEIKGINMVWLSEVDLTNLNSGEGESNFVDVKKFKKDNIEYPYVSGQAMRFYLRESIRRDLNDNEAMCLPNNKGETCGNIENCINCDLFGFMTTIKDKGADVRTSPIKISPAIGLLPFEDNSNIDFLTRKHRVGEGEKNKGDIVNVEIGTNIYKSGLSIDVRAVGAIEIIKENENTNVPSELEMDFKLKNENERYNRIKKVLTGILSISNYSKQARLLVDFTPDIFAISLQNQYNHRLQKLFILDEDRNLNISRINDILDDVLEYSNDIVIGWTSGIINNEIDVKKVFKDKDIQIFTPKKAIHEVINLINVDD